MKRPIKIIFHHSEKTRERNLARAFLKGARKFGCDVEARELCASPEVADYDIGCFVGVKSKRIFNMHREAGIHTILFDKGYVRDRIAGGRTWEYWRVALDAHQPTETTLSRMKMGPERWQTFGLDIAPWRKRGNHIVIAGSSAKYHDFYDLPHPADWTVALVEEIRRYTDRPIIYRPKPSWKEARRIAGTTWSGGDETIKDALWGAHCLVTHGSNACFEAALMGVPSIVLGDAVAKPISSTSIAEIEDPIMGKRDQWFQNLAWHMFTEAEMLDGLAWTAIRGWLKRVPKEESDDAASI